MDCKEYRQDMLPYLKDELDDSRISKLLEHVESCPECKDNLKIQFFISEGLNRLENNKRGYNLLNDFENRLESSRERSRRISFDNMLITWGSLGLIVFVLLMLLSSLFI